MFSPCLRSTNSAPRLGQIAALHARLKRLGVNLRPHGKTAKSYDVLRMALADQAGRYTASLAMLMTMTIGR